MGKKVIHSVMNLWHSLPRRAVRLQFLSTFMIEIVRFGDIKRTKGYGVSGIEVKGQQ